MKPEEGTARLFGVAVTCIGAIEDDPPHLEGGSDRSADLEHSFDAIMAELVRLDVVDPSVEGSLATGHVEVSVTIMTDDMASAVQQADAAIRTAFHAAELTTDKWPTDRTAGSSFPERAGRRTMHFEKIEILQA